MENNSQSSKVPLEQLLKEISENKVENLQEAFGKAAEILILHSVLNIGDAKYQIKEIEFYFSSHASQHTDPYVHSQQYTVTRQAEFGEWYFHRYTSQDKYTHNRRGLDITFGSKAADTTGGILIRGIKPLSGGVPVQGPSKVVAEIIEKLAGADTDIPLDTLANGIGGFVFADNSPLRITQSDMPFSKIHKVKRFGLSVKKEDADNTYQNLPYRYFDEDYLKVIKGKEEIFRDMVGQGIYTNEQSKELIGYAIKSFTR